MISAPQGTKKQEKGSKLIIKAQMDGYRRWGIFTQCNIPQQKEDIMQSPITEKVDMIILSEVRETGRESST